MLDNVLTGAKATSSNQGNDAAGLDCTAVVSTLSLNGPTALSFYGSLPITDQPALSSGERLFPGKS